MKKILLFTGVLFFAGCGEVYTVKNESSTNIMVGSMEVEPDGCVELSDAFYGLFGDFPVTISREGELIVSDEGETDYQARHYVVRPDGSVTEVDEGCEPIKKIQGNDSEEQ